MDIKVEVYIEEEGELHYNRYFYFVIFGENIEKEIIAIPFVPKHILNKLITWRRIKKQFSKKIYVVWNYRRELPKNVKLLFTISIEQYCIFLEKILANNKNLTPKVISFSELSLEKYKKYRK